MQTLSNSPHHLKRNLRCVSWTKSYKIEGIDHKYAKIEWPYDENSDESPE